MIAFCPAKVLYQHDTPSQVEGQCVESTDTKKKKKKESVSRLIEIRVDKQWEKYYKIKQNWDR